MNNTFNLTGDIRIQNILDKSGFNENTVVDFEKEIKSLNERFSLFQEGSKKIPGILAFIKFPTGSFPKNDTENFISVIPKKDVDLMGEKLRVIRNDNPGLLKNKIEEELKDFNGLQNLLNSAQTLLQNNRLLQVKMIKLGYDIHSKEIISLKFQAGKISSFQASSELLSKLIHTYKFVQNSNQKNSAEYKKTIKNLAVDIEEYYNNQHGEVDKEYIQTILNMETAKKVLDNVKTKNLPLYEKIKPKLEEYTSNDKNIAPFPEKIPVEIYAPIIEAIKEQTKKYLPDEMNNFKGSEEEVTPEEMQKYAQQIIDNIYKDEEYSDTPDEKKWKTVLDDRPGYMCEIKKKELKVPSRNYTKAEFLGSMYHEVFIHIFRYINGSKIDSLETLPDYLDFEEGLASIVQQYAEGKKELTFGKRPIRQVSIALASASLSYQEVREVLEINEEDVVSSGSTVERELTRIYRGTAVPINEDCQDGNVNKAIYHKDKAYFQGSYKIYLWMKKIAETTGGDLKLASKKVFNKILIHSYDATNLSHISYLKQYFNWSKEEEEKAYINYLV